MKTNIGQNIRSLRLKRHISQEELAETTGVTVQAISKWETGKANPDVMLLPKLAEYFGVTIDNLFYTSETGSPDAESTKNLLEQNSQWWENLEETDILEQSSRWWEGVEESGLVATSLPGYGFFTPTEDTLCLLGDIRGKAVLEIACGSGGSLVWAGRKGAKELWGLDISAAQIKRAKQLLNKNGQKAELFVSPMESDPGLPHNHFDLVFSIYGIGWTINLDKTILNIAKYLKTGGRLVFAWDNPLMQCIAAQNGQYILSKSYVEEQDFVYSNNFGNTCLHNWKTSSYLNCLAKHGFLIEQVVEESTYNEKESAVSQEEKFYSAGKAKLLNPSIIIKAQKL